MIRNEIPLFWSKMILMDHDPPKKRVFAIRSFSDPFQFHLNGVSDWTKVKKRFKTWTHLRLLFKFTWEFLVGGFFTPLKNMSQNGIISPNRGEKT